MENVKELQNDPDKRKKALKSTTCSDVIQLALHITMVVIGVQVRYEILLLEIRLLFSKSKL